MGYFHINVHVSQTVKGIKPLLGYDLSHTIDNIKPSRLSDFDTNYRSYRPKTLTLKSMGKSHIGAVLNCLVKLVFENKISFYVFFFSTIWYMNGADRSYNCEIIRKKEV